MTYTRECTPLWKIKGEDGRKKIQIRRVVYGTLKHLPTIRSDLELLEELLQAYPVK